MLREWFVAHYTYIVDHSRVVLSIPDGWGSDYINASYINVRPTVDISKLSAMFIMSHSCFCSCFITQGEHGDVYIASQGVYTAITENVEYSQCIYYICMVLQYIKGHCIPHPKPSLISGR